MIRLRSLLSIVVSFIASWFGRPSAPALVPATDSVQTQPVRKIRPMNRSRRRHQLRILLKRIDGGGKHYGSKRPLAQKKYGKRSGRQ